jgi:hypothetical protein
MFIMKHIYLSLLSLCLCALTVQARSTGPLASPEVRDLAAKQMIESHANYMAIYTKGLVCSSCGIGLRIHISKLDGVDKSAFKKGVDLDSEKQLVLVAFKADAEIDVEGVRKAVYNAGYDPVHYYLWSQASGVTQTAYPAAEE